MSNSKDFGLRKLNLINESGTPNISSPNNLNLNAVTVAISTDLSIGGQVSSDVIVGSGYSVGIGTTEPRETLDVVGNIKATHFYGDGSGITGVTATGSGIEILDNDSPLGVAATINFGSNLSVSPISSGIATISVDLSSNSEWIATDVGIHTLSNVGIGTTNPTSPLTVKGSTSLESLSATSAIFTGKVGSTNSYFYEGLDPSLIGSTGGSINGSSFGYSTGGFYRYTSTGTDNVLKAYYKPTTQETVVLDIDGDFALKTLSGDTKFSVSGTGDIIVGNNLNVSGVSTFSGNTRFDGYLGLYGTNNINFFDGSNNVIGSIDKNGDITYWTRENYQKHIFQNSFGPPQTLFEIGPVNYSYKDFAVSGITSTKDLIVYGTGNETGSISSVALMSRTNYLDFGPAIPNTSAPQSFAIRLGSDKATGTFGPYNILQASWTNPSGSVSLNNWNGTDGISINDIGVFAQTKPVIVGAVTSTGTANQKLQVTGGAYVSDSVGIGTTIPRSTLDVNGTLNVSGVVTAQTFYGDASGLENVPAAVGINTLGTSYFNNLSVSGVTTTAGFIVTDIADFNGNDAILYHTGDQKFSTTSDGVVINGLNKIEAASFGTVGSYDGIQVITDSTDQANIYHELEGLLHIDNYRATGGSIAFRVNANSGIVTEKARITSSGVGIGTTNPGYYLDAGSYSTNLENVGLTVGSVGSAGTTLLVNGEAIIDGMDIHCGTSGPIWNAYFGYKAGRASSGGNVNAGFGPQALLSNVSGNWNAAFGSGALRNSTGNENSAFGASAGESVTTGQSNTLIGRATGTSLTTESDNTFLGHFSGNTSTGSGNLFLGSNVGRYMSSGSKNVFIGNFSGYNNDIDLRLSSNNIVLTDGDGNLRLYTNSSGNTGIGTTNPQTKLHINGVLGFGTDEYGNTNIRIGDNTTGSSIIDGHNNIFMGIGAGNSTTSGYWNNFLGGFAGFNNTSGGGNIFMCEYAGFNNTSGGSNTFLNTFAGYSNNNGNANNFIGAFAGYSNIDGDHNNFFGNKAGDNNKSGNYNIYLGPLSGISTAASRKIIIGSGGPGPDIFDSPDTTKDTQFAVGVRTDANPSKYWLVGDENFNVGIGTTNPTEKLTVKGDVGVGGTLTIQQTTEVLNTKTGAASTVTHDFSTGSIWYHSGITGNFTLNLTNVPTTENRSITVTLFLDQGGTGYYADGLEIDGVTQTIKWANNATPIPSTNKLDVQSFTLIRTNTGAGVTWVTLGQLINYN